MKTKAFALLVTLTSLSACSTYHTNSDIIFDSVMLSGQKPTIPINNVKVSPDQLTFLGWVDAQVTKPTLFHKQATTQQADIVLAERAKAMGADTVIHVEYKRSFNILAQGSIEARGQAVRVNRLHIGEADPAVVISDTAIKSSQYHQLTQEILASTRSNTERDLQKTPLSTKVQTLKPDTANATDGSVAPISHSNELTTIDDKAAIPVSTTTPGYISIEELYAQQQATLLASKTKNTEKDISATIEKTNTYQPTILNQREQASSLKIILENAYFLKKKADQYNDKDMDQAATRLIHQLESHIVEYTGQSPQ